MAKKNELQLEEKPEKKATTKKPRSPRASSGDAGASKANSSQPSTTAPAEGAVVQERSKTDTPAPVVLEPGRAICHEPFYDGRVRRIAAMDEPEFSGQHHYVLEVQETDLNLGVVKKVHREDIHFQKGPLQTVAPNGWTEADLVKILIDRLENFSKPGVAQPENEQALKGLREAQAAFDKRCRRKIEEREKSLKAKKSRDLSPKPVIY